MSPFPPLFLPRRDSPSGSSMVTLSLIGSALPDPGPYPSDRRFPWPHGDSARFQSYHCEILPGRSIGRCLTIGASRVPHLPVEGTAPQKSGHSETTHSHGAIRYGKIGGAK